MDVAAAMSWSQGFLYGVSLKFQDDQRSHFIKSIPEMTAHMASIDAYCQKHAHDTIMDSTTNLVKETAVKAFGY
jgi:hypothetical protein